MLGYAVLLPQSNAQWFEKKNDNESYARLSPFKVPVLKKGREIGTGDVTMFVKLTDEDYLDEVCSRLPLIRDTVVEYFYENPVVLEPDKSFRLSPAVEPLTRMVARISGSRHVETVLLIKGDVETPGDGCRRMGSHEKLSPKGPIRVR